MLFWHGHFDERKVSMGFGRTDVARTVLNFRANICIQIDKFIFFEFMKNNLKIQKYTCADTNVYRNAWLEFQSLVDGRVVAPQIFTLRNSTYLI